MLHRGKMFYEKLVAARGKVAKVAAHFIKDGSVIFIYFEIFSFIWKFFLVFYFFIIFITENTYSFKI